MPDKRKKIYSLKKLNVAQTIQVVVSLLVGILLLTIWYKKKKIQEEIAGKFVAPVPTSSTLLRIVN